MVLCFLVLACCLGFPIVLGLVLGVLVLVDVGFDLTGRADLPFVEGELRLLGVVGVAGVGVEGGAFLRVATVGEGVLGGFCLDVVVTFFLGVGVSFSVLDCDNDRFAGGLDVLAARPRLSGLVMM